MFTPDLSEPLIAPTQPPQHPDFFVNQFKTASSNQAEFGDLAIQKSMEPCRGPIRISC
jgi:hypothetical protein